jgi:hypothetical protein
VSWLSSVLRYRTWDLTDVFGFELHSVGRGGSTVKGVSRTFILTPDRDPAAGRSMRERRGICSGSASFPIGNELRFPGLSSSRFQTVLVPPTLPGFYPPLEWDTSDPDQVRCGRAPDVRDRKQAKNGVGHLCVKADLGGVHLTLKLAADYLFRSSSL